MRDPIKLAISGSAGQIGYSVIFRIAHGDIFGKDQPIFISMLETTHGISIAKGVAMELTDCAFPLLAGFSITDCPVEAFRDADYVMLFGSMPRRAGMDRADLLEKNKEIFVVQGKALNESAKPSCRVLVIGNPANTNALVLSKYATKLAPGQITGMTRLDHNRTIGSIVDKLNEKLSGASRVDSSMIKNVVVFGNHSDTMVPVIDNATLQRLGQKAVPLREAIGDDEWVKNVLLPTVRRRGQAIIEARGSSSSASAAAASIDHMKDWFHGTPAGEYVSVSLLSEPGNPYGIEPGLMYSMPCKSVNGKWEIVPGLKITDDVQKDMKKSEADLIHERKLALNI